MLPKMGMQISGSIRVKPFRAAFIYAAGGAMPDQPKPTKEQARHWIDQRAENRQPLPDQKELRRQLGMDLIEAERKQKRD